MRHVRQPIHAPTVLPAVICPLAQKLHSESRIHRNMCMCPPFSSFISTALLFWLAAPMALPSLFSFSLLFLLFLSSSTRNGAVVEAQVDDTSLQLVTDAMEWPTTTSLYSSSSYPFGYEGDEEELGEAAKNNRRALFWHRIRYYISYGALSANRVPCPPRSGRSYYTHNCYRARGPVRPYHRGCSAITRCRR